MSLSYITSLMKKDTSLHYPNIVQWAQHLNRTVIVLHVESTLPFGDELPGIAYIGMLLVNVKGQCAWVHSMVNPEKKIPAVLARKLQTTLDVLGQHKTWKDGWSEGFFKMASTSTVVSLQEKKHDFRAIDRQYVRQGSVLNWLHQLSLKETFLTLHPTRSGTTSDIIQFYQVSQSGDHTPDERLVLAANVLEVMLGETGIAQFGVVHAPAVESISAADFVASDDVEVLPEDRNLSAIQQLSASSEVVVVPRPEDDPEWRQKLDDARSYLLQEASYSRDPVDFFTRIESQYAVRITPGNKRINGYSLNVNGYWLRASEISPDLGWNQLLENQAWPFGVAQISTLSKWFHQL